MRSGADQTTADTRLTAVVPDVRDGLAAAELLFTGLSGVGPLLVAVHAGEASYRG